MQYLKEDAHGNRNPVNVERFNRDSMNKNYVQIIASKDMFIYRIAGYGSRVAQPHLKYGGRGNPKNPTGYRGA